MGQCRRIAWFFHLDALPFAVPEMGVAWCPFVRVLCKDPVDFAAFGGSGWSARSCSAVTNICAKREATNHLTPSCRRAPIRVRQPNKFAATGSLINDELWISCRTRRFGLWSPAQTGRLSEIMIGEALRRAEDQGNTRPKIL
jgi:hypothetical protein